MSASKAATALRTAGLEVIRKNLTWGTSGNISVRLSEEEFLISASGVALDMLAPSALVYCGLDGGLLGGSGRPSVETRMHAEVYRARPDVGSVLHASPFYATMVASSSLELEPNLTTDTAYFVREVRRVPFCSPGSMRLAKAAVTRAASCNALLLDNHGALTLGRSPDEVVQRMEVLENMCRMLVYGALGIPLRPLRQEDVDEFIESVSAHGTA